MKTKRAFYWGCTLPWLLFGLASSTTANDKHSAAPPGGKTTVANQEQAPGWSGDDREFFLHGSMSTEAAPETVLRAFIRTYPDLFPKEDLSHFGLIPDTTFG